MVPLATANTSPQGGKSVFATSTSDLCLTTDYKWITKILVCRNINTNIYAPDYTGIQWIVIECDSPAADMAILFSGVLNVLKDICSCETSTGKSKWWPKRKIVSRPIAMGLFIDNITKTIAIGLFIDNIQNTNRNGSNYRQYNNRSCGMTLTIY